MLIFFSRINSKYSEFRAKANFLMVLVVRIFLCLRMDQLTWKGYQSRCEITVRTCFSNVAK
jgi:hypothetical protein